MISYKNLNFCSNLSYFTVYTNFCFGGGLKKTDLTPLYSNISQASLAANLIYHTANFCNLVRSGQVFFSKTFYNSLISFNLKIKKKI